MRSLTFKCLQFVTFKTQHGRVFFFPPIYNLSQFNTLLWKKSLHFRTYPITQGLSLCSCSGTYLRAEIKCIHIYARCNYIFFSLVIVPISSVLFFFFFLTVQHQGQEFIPLMKPQKRLRSVASLSLIVWSLQRSLHISQCSYVGAPLHRCCRDHQKLRGGAHFQLFRNCRTIRKPFGDYCSISRRARRSVGVTRPIPPPSPPHTVAVWNTGTDVKQGSHAPPRLIHYPRRPLHSSLGDT